MKKSTTLLILLTAALTTAAQFSTTFNPMPWAHAPSAVAEANGYYYIAGSCRNSQNGTANDVMYLTTLDATGNIVDQYFSDSSDEFTLTDRHCYAMEATPNGFIMAGDSSGYFYVTALDMAHNQLWSYTGGIDAAREIVPTASGYVVSGDSGSVALDFSGNLLWQSADLRNDITATANGYISLSRSGALTISGTDLSGNNPWSVTTGIQMVPQAWRSPHVASNGNVYIACVQSDSLTILACDQYGTIQLQKSIPGYQFTVNELHICPMGGLIITGSHADSAFCMRTDFNANVLWQHTRVLTDSFAVGCDAIQTSTGDFFWAGSQANSFDYMGVNFAEVSQDALSLSVYDASILKLVLPTGTFDLQGRIITDKNYSGVCISNGRVEYRNTQK